MAEGSAAEWLWWSESAGARVTRTLLAPASLAFGAIVRVRNEMFDARLLPVRTPPLPAISVGNITVGGTGKTPVSSWLATKLAARGARPAIVLRGYGGDETLVHARLTPDIPVIANPDRLEAIERAASAGADVIVLDDAFQHRRVARVADVVLLSADETDAPVRLLPSGPYRERDAALARASLVLVTRKAASLERAQLVAARARAAAPNVPVAIAHLTLSHLHLGDGAPRPIASLAGRRAVAVAGIGNASAFAAQLTQLGLSVRLHAFPDHHPFSRADAERLARDVAPDEIALCTLKDAVKLLPLWPRQAPAMGYVSQAVNIDEGGSLIDALLDLAINARLRQL